jgi:hypothetical protein
MLALIAYVWINPLRGSDIGIATCDVPFKLLGLATPIQCGGVIGIEPNRLGVVRGGAVVVFLFGVRVAAVIPDGKCRVAQQSSKAEVI